MNLPVFFTFLQALVAGLRRVFSIATPGIVNLPVFFTSRVASSARLCSMPRASLRLSSLFWAISSAIADLVMLLTAAAFIAAFIPGCGVNSAKSDSGVEGVEVSQGLDHLES